MVFSINIYYHNGSTLVDNKYKPHVLQYLFVYFQGSVPFLCELYIANKTLSYTLEWFFELLQMALRTGFGIL